MSNKTLSTSISGPSEQDSDKTGMNIDFDINDHIPYLLVRSANLIGQITHKRYQDAVPDGLELSLREFRTLLIVASRGVVAPAAVADATGMDRSTVTRALSTLQKKGLIAESKNEKDKRAKFLNLTADGLDLSNRIIPRMDAYTKKIEERISAHELEQFKSVLDQMVEVFIEDAE